MTTVARNPQPGAASAARRIGVLVLAARLHVLACIRAPEFAIGVVTVPALLYAMFGLPSAANVLAGGTRIGTMMMVSLTCYGVVSLAIFTFGDEVAKDRARGWHRTQRATPIPVSLPLAARGLAATVIALLITGTTSLLAATAGGVRLPAGAWLAFAAAAVAGVLAFSTLGLAIAHLARPRTASVVANLIFLPLAFLSGFFFPLSELPGGFRHVAPWLPTHHYGQLVWQQVAPATDVAEFTGVAPSGAWVHLAWLGGATVVFGALAGIGARREATTRRG